MGKNNNKSRNNARNKVMMVTNEGEETTEGLNKSPELAEKRRHKTPEKKDAGEAEEEEDEADGEDEQFAMKLDTLLDCLQNAKCGQTRLKHWTMLCKALGGRYCFPYLDNRQLTLVELFEHGLKGSPEEVKLTAQAIALALINFDRDDDFAETIIERFAAILERYLIDRTLKPSTRAKCAIVLSFAYSITEATDKTRPLMEQLLNIGMLRLGGQQQSSAGEHPQFQANCLEMFTYLVSSERTDYQHRLLLSHIDKLKATLDSPNLLIRLAVGEAIAMLLIKVGSQLPDSEDVLDLYDRLEDLTTHHQKSQSKKHLRLQRHHFRQISKSLAEGDADGFFEPDVVHFGRETLILDTWATRVQYQALCDLIGQGIHLHLKHNPFLRDIFALGPVLLDEPIVTRKDRQQRQQMFSANRKYREQSRNKQRNQRHQSFYE